MSELRPEPYVGISGVATVEQHQAILEAAQRKCISQLGHFVMIGIQATNKTQILEIENKRGRMWHPVGDEISHASMDDESGLTRPYIHCYFEDDSELSIGLDIIMQRTQHYCHGVQINGLRWVEKDYRYLLNDFREKYPEQSIIIQASKDTLNNYSPAQVASALESMPIDYVLLDPSSGFGIKMELEQIQPYVDEIYQRHIPVGVGISGGLEARNLDELFGPLLEIYADLSCDAEGRLRKGRKGKTVIDLKAVDEYLSEWKRIQTLSKSS